MTEDEGDVLPLAEVCEPVPTEHTLSTYNDVFSVSLDGREEGIWLCGQVAVEQDLASLVEDTDVHGPGVEIDTAVELMLFGIESHWGLLLSVRSQLPSIRSGGSLRGGLNEYPSGWSGHGVGGMALAVRGGQQPCRLLPPLSHTVGHTDMHAIVVRHFVSYWGCK
jgi:hypothetical protein